MLVAQVALVAQDVLEAQQEYQEAIFADQIFLVLLLQEFKIGKGAPAALVVKDAQVYQQTHAIHAIRQHHVLA